MPARIGRTAGCASRFSERNGLRAARPCREKPGVLRRQSWNRAASKPNSYQLFRPKISQYPMTKIATSTMAWLT
jgi:hypothetical protein